MASDGWDVDGITLAAAADLEPGVGQNRIPSNLDLIGGQAWYYKFVKPLAARRLIADVSGARLDTSKLLETRAAVEGPHFLSHGFKVLMHTRHMKTKQLLASLMDTTYRTYLRRPRIHLLVYPMLFRKDRGFSEDSNQVGLEYMPGLTPDKLY